MWRYLAGAGAMGALIGAGMLLFSGQASPPRALLPTMPATAGEQEAEALPDAAPAATAKTREQRRFGRVDKDKDGAITREEFLAQRRKAFARLDTYGDGRLGFEEWATRAIGKFAAADRDRSGAMTPSEFATTAVKRKPRPRVDCPPARAQAVDLEG